MPSFPHADGTMRDEIWQPEDVLRRALKRAGIVTGYSHVCRRKGCRYSEDRREVDRLRFGFFQPGCDVTALRRCSGREGLARSSSRAAYRRESVAAALKSHGMRAMRSLVMR
jgi:hypothetical protein